MERSPLPTTFEITRVPLASLEKQSALQQVVFRLLRYFADKLAPYQTPERINFPTVATPPERSHQDSLIAKMGYTLETLSLDGMTDRELVPWVARYLSNEAEPISGDRTSNKFKIDFLMKTMQEATDKDFSVNLETAVFNLLRTISHQEELAPEVLELRRNLKALAREAQFKSCERFISAKAKNTRSA